MADNPSAPTSSEGRAGSAPNGNNGSNSAPSDFRHHNGERRGRGGGRGQSRGDRTGGKGFGSRESGRRKKEMGRQEYERDNNGYAEKRNRDDHQNKRRKLKEDGGEDHPFSKEEIEAEGRRPKRKVAVMIGYAGTGYKGMQINSLEKTIEGDLFKAFVAAGAISKANADDPKKSSLVRCARTDKGVHAAGNVISLKLIVEDEDVVQKINENLPPQIRVWGYERTNGAFSCYQTCDSRWYEYLIPTYCLLPPQPQSYLCKKLVEHAEKEGVSETLKARQEDVASFWEETEEKYIKPILDGLEPELRESVMKAIYTDDEANLGPGSEMWNGKRIENEGKSHGGTPVPEDESITTVEDELKDGTSAKIKDTEDDANISPQDAVMANVEEAKKETEVKSGEAAEKSKSSLTPEEIAIKAIKAAIITAKKAYRISPFRKQRLQDALNMYVGTKNFHNYTIQKWFTDPSAKRVIKSFQVGAEPIIIHNTEWLSLKVHGQSFMMHQIRKMVAMAALLVRCGSPLQTMKDSFGAMNISIPKAPGLGLLLERPIFDSYNERAVKDLEREKIDFSKYEKEILEFKQREIYDRIFREEDKEHQFHAFFHHLDHIHTRYFLWVTASGIDAAQKPEEKDRDESDDDEKPDAKGEEG